MYRSELGNALMLRFRADGGINALDEAIACFRQAIKDSPHHTERARAHTGLGGALQRRFERTRQPCARAA
ncbi:hypothetical protein AB0B45_32185 [Nonomuraea sp. NPDC049152]|uniref:hypothetical protein n=1 Tax=Nonomuraea sp. NPDC049152 TaxID=3154350 RepID=UPI0033E4F561